MQVPAVEMVMSEPSRSRVVREVDRLLAAGRFSQGENVEGFEAEFAAFTGVPHAVAVSNGTTALELIHRAVGVWDRDVLVPAGTNYATYVAAERAGARVVLTDMDPHTLAPSLRHLQDARTERTAAVTVVHTGGIVTPEIEAIAAWCRDEGIALVEDCAHAHGSRRDGRHAGSFGTAGAFSFFATKVMTSGEGGMVVTADPRLADEVRLLRNLGKPQPWVSHHTGAGWNARMPELAAVLGRAQLAELPQAVEARQQVLEGYREALEDAGIEGFIAPDHPASGYKAVLRLPPGTDREALKEELRRHGVATAGEVYATPLHHQPVLAARHAGETFPGAEAACAGQLCLPIYPTLGEERLVHVVKSLAASLPVVAGRD